MEVSTPFLSGDILVHSSGILAGDGPPRARARCELKLEWAQMKEDTIREEQRDGQANVGQQALNRYHRGSRKE